MMSESPAGAGVPHAWPHHDMAFAANELAQEYPKVMRDQVVKAVNSAAPFVPPEKGRVELMRRSREFLRFPDGPEMGQPDRPPPGIAPTAG
jgi:hypothetical protein